ncbi:uncharacterized protein BJX67DRAFT_315174 [Aspergillus lucknowensis]|uniref:Uncharacterized protein n=1 Tax=Aspergillus lucknowensis TaxID=176173 RepID=A0ABR4L976_9EURO
MCGNSSPRRCSPFGNHICIWREGSRKHIRITQVQLAAKLDNIGIQNNWHVGKRVWLKFVFAWVAVLGEMVYLKVALHILRVDVAASKTFSFEEVVGGAVLDILDKFVFAIAIQISPVNKFTSILLRCLSGEAPYQTL